MTLSPGKAGAWPVTLGISTFAPCQGLKGPRGGAGGQAHSRGTAHQPCVGPVLSSSSSPTPHVFPPTCGPSSFSSRRQLSAAATGLSRGGGGGGGCLASSRFLGNRAAFLARSLGRWPRAWIVGVGQGCGLRGPESTRGRAHWLPWERKGMQLGKESSDGGWLGRGTLS